MKAPRVKMMVGVALVIGSLAAVSVGVIGSPAAAMPIATASEVTPIVIPGDPTPVRGVDRHLPPRVGDRPYAAGPGRAANIRAYQGSGEYAADIAAVARAAEGYLDTWLIETCADTSQAACRPVVVFDIDDTLLDWYPIFNMNDFALPAGVRARSVASCATPAIEATKDLFNAAKRLGTDVFLLSGRDEAARTATEGCLRKRGITGWSKLALRSPAQAALTAKAYKSATRARWERQGWRIAFSIGDQVSDVAGGHAARGFLLPNPMHFTP